MHPIAGVYGRLTLSAIIEYVCIMLIERAEEGDGAMEVWRVAEGLEHGNGIKGVERVRNVDIGNCLCGMRVEN